MSIKNSNGTIGNRTRDLPACSAAPQPTAPPRAKGKSMVCNNASWVHERAKFRLFNTVELHLFGLSGTASHPDLQKIRII
jgi:hypothetical protein